MSRVGARRASDSTRATSIAKLTITSIRDAAGGRLQPSAAARVAGDGIGDVGGEQHFPRGDEGDSTTRWRSDAEAGNIRALVCESLTSTQ